MPNVKGLVTKRIMQIKTSKVLPLVIEIIAAENTILTGKTGSITMKPNKMSKELKTFLEAEGILLTFTPAETRRGKAEIAGVKVKVSPLPDHNSYEGGAMIQYKEDNPMRYDNTKILKKFFAKHGIDLTQECQRIEEIACISKKSGGAAP